jgi:hypothetical protein
MTFDAKFEGQFAEQIQARIDKWSGAQPLGSRIHVPDEVSWWYWQEYGTGAAGEAPQASGHSYSIDPVVAKELRFPGPGGVVTRTRHVDHPGIPARHSVGKVIPEIHAETGRMIREAFESDNAADDLNALQSALHEATQSALQTIVESIAEHIPGTRAGTDEIPAGRLRGRTAASEFADLATVIDH